MLMNSMYGHWYSMYGHWYFNSKATWSDFLAIIVFFIYLSYKSIILESYGLLPI